MAQEAEEARTAGRDPESLDKEAVHLREEENQLRAGVENSRTLLEQATIALGLAETQLKTEEDRVAAALRAFADQREGTARQEGHIKSLRARLDAIAEEISRLTKARDDAQGRTALAQREYSTFEIEIAGAGAGEKGLDSQFESAKSALDGVKAKLVTLTDDERSADKERTAFDAKLEAMRLTSQMRDGASALLRDSRGVKILGSLAGLCIVTK